MKKLTDWKSRFLSSTLISLLVAASVYFAFAPIGWALVLAIFIVLGTIASTEYCAIASHKGLHLSKKTLATFALLYILASFGASFVMNLNFLPAFVLTLGVTVLFILHKNPSDEPLAHISTAVFGLIYIAVPLGFIVYILYGPYIVEDGRMWLIYFLVTVKIGDVAAYFLGKTVGNTALSKISPKKTREGFFAALGAGLLFSIGFYFLIQIPGIWPMRLTLWQAVFLGIVLPAIGQFSDLAESLIKRDAHVKDSNQLPGLGGVLDMIDSLLFTSAFLYFYIKLTHFV